jgi:hypothetical protein
MMQRPGYSWYRFYATEPCLQARTYAAAEMEERKADLLCKRPDMRDEVSEWLWPDDSTARNPAEG